GYHVDEPGVVNDRNYTNAQLWGGDVFFTGTAGNDYFRNDTWLRSHASGNDGNDYLIGGWNTDHLSGGHGSDHLYGRQGVDYLNGGYGDDVLDGGDDGVRDSLIGGPGADKFQRDWYWTGLFLVNRDKPVDFGSGDSYYG